MRRSSKFAIGIASCLLVITLAVLLTRFDSIAQVFSGRPELDRSRPVPAKGEVIRTWQARQDSIRSFRFAWTETQTHPKGWIPNPRYPQREFSDIPKLLGDRTYTVSKTLAVDGGRMRYTFQLNRKEESDGVRVNSAQGNNTGLGEGKHYRYESVFDGQTGKTRITSLTDGPPAATIAVMSNVDAQNLDIKPLMMAFRPLDPAMGDLLVDRAVTNLVRTIHRGKSTFLLEEERDPSGWKTIFRIEPERAFLVSEILVPFEQKPIIEIDIDYTEDPKWGWIPSGWHITQMLADGSTRLVSEARIASYSINQPIGAEEFLLK